MAYELSKEEENKCSYKNLRNFKIIFLAISLLKGTKPDYSTVGDAEYIEEN